MLKPRNLQSMKTSRMCSDVISDYIESSFKNKTGSLYQSVVARKFYHFKHEGSYKVVNNLLNNRVFKRVCVLLKESGNTDTIKELMKIRRIININNHSEKSVSEKDSQLSHDFENFARFTNHYERNLYSYFTSKVSLIPSRTYLICFPKSIQW